MIHDIQYTAEWWVVVNVVLSTVFSSHSGTCWSSQTDLASVTYAVKVSLLDGLALLIVMFNYESQIQYAIDADVCSFVTE